MALGRPVTKPDETACQNCGTVFTPLPHYPMFDKSVGRHLLAILLHGVIDDLAQQLD